MAVAEANFGQFGEQRGVSRRVFLTLMASLGVAGLGLGAYLEWMKQRGVDNVNVGRAVRGLDGWIDGLKRMSNGGEVGIEVARQDQRWAEDARVFIELNGHAIEKRGQELANYIHTIVSAAFMPGPNGKDNPEKMIRKVLCGAEGIVNGVSRGVELIVEVESRTTPGVKRIASLIFGEVDGKWKMVTALYKDGDMKKYMAKQTGRGWSGNCPDDMPPPGMLLTMP